MADIDLRVVKTLENIDNSLLNNLNCLSFTKITVDSLCTSAKINRSTFYKYYKDKYDLLDKFIEKVLLEFSSNVKTEFISAPPSTVENLTYNIQFKKLLVLFSKNKYVYSTLWNASIDRDVYTEMTNIVTNNILEDLNSNFKINSDKQEYTSLFAYLLSSNMMIVVKWYMENEDTVSINEVVKLMSKITSEGLFMTLRKSIC